MRLEYRTFHDLKVCRHLGDKGRVGPELSGLIFGMIDHGLNRHASSSVVYLTLELDEIPHHATDYGVNHGE
jgi:hypothetical protein